jgi:hypothetical protein
MSTFLTEQENKMIRLVEERGVAAFPYKTAIKQILDYCQEQTKNMRPGDMMTFNVPPSLTKKIDFIHSLNIVVQVIDAENGAYLSGGGQVKLTMLDNLINGKYDNGCIEIYAFSFCGHIYERTILNSLYHELNHLYEAWKELVSTNSMSLFAAGSIRANAKITCFPISVYNDIATEINYRLYSQSELNSMVAGVYGDLSGMKSLRKNFNVHLQKTQAYAIYNKLKDDLRMLVVYLKRNPEYVMPFIQNLNTYGIQINPYYKNENGYIKEYNRRTQFLLKQLIRGIGKSASLYYDSIEVPEDNVNIIVK